MRVSRLAIFLIALATLSARNAEAAPIVDFTGSSGNITGVDAVWGWSFTTSISLSVSALGMFDYGPTGLTESHSVGLWTDAGTLLASTTVGNTSTPVTSTAFGRWLFESVAPLTIAPGTYVLGAYYDGSGSAGLRDVFSIDPPFTTISGVTAISGRSNTSTSVLAFPSSTHGFQIILGPNMLAEPVQAVPEPATLSLLGLGLGTAALRRRWKRS